MFNFILGYVMGERTQSRAASLARDAAVSDGMRGKQRDEDLNARVDRLLLVVQAMWSLLEEQGLTDEQLIAKIQELDLADGITDGRLTVSPTDCLSCGSKVAPGLAACQFCGTPVPTEDLTDPLHLI